MLSRNAPFYGTVLDAVEKKKKGLNDFVSVTSGGTQAGGLGGGGACV